MPHPLTVDVCQPRPPLLHQLLYLAASLAPTGSMAMSVLMALRSGPSTASQPLHLLTHAMCPILFHLHNVSYIGALLSVYTATTPR